MSSAEDILEVLKACWCEALADTVGGSPAQCCISPVVPVIAECCAGVAWIRLVDAYPSKAFPSGYTQPDNCRIDTWAINVELGISRCSPQPCGVTDQVCCEEDEQAARVQLSDWHAMRRVFSCCASATLDEFNQPVIRQDEIVVGRYKVDDSGVCTYATIQATIRVSDPCGC